VRFRVDVKVCEDPEKWASGFAEFSPWTNFCKPVNGVMCAQCKEAGLEYLRVGVPAGTRWPAGCQAAHDRMDEIIHKTAAETKARYEASVSVHQGLIAAFERLSGS
jgi:hypothetical protein